MAGTRSRAIRSCTSKEDANAGKVEANWEKPQRLTILPGMRKTSTAPTSIRPAMAIGLAIPLDLMMVGSQKLIEYCFN